MTPVLLRRMLVALAICGALLGGGMLSAQTTHRIYLPAVARGGTAPTPTTGPGPGVGGKLYFEALKRTKSAGAAVDPRGGMHAVFVDAVPYAERPAVTYTFCAGGAACGEPGSWRSVRLADQVDEVQLLLTPAGQPRLLIQSYRSSDSTKLFLYGTCDADCAQAGNWTLTEVATAWGTAAADIHQNIMPQRSFALDPQGRPRFIYYDRNWFVEPDHIGMFYASCEAACQSASSWTLTPIGGEAAAVDITFEYPALTFTPQGQPRAIAHVRIRGQDAAGISFIGCDADCTAGESWRSAIIYERGSGFDVGWDIAVDRAGQPRVAFFPGTLSEGRGEQLYYAWCNAAALADCLDGDRWEGTTLGLPVSSGKQPDLLIDPLGRPRIAVLDKGNLGYLWCTAACEADAAQWSFRAVETAEAMQQANPKAIPPHCDQDVWSPLTPVLALDAQGLPHIAYDVSVEARCSYVDPVDQKPFFRFEPVWRGVRWVFFPQP